MAFNFNRPKFSGGAQPLYTRDVLRAKATLDFPSVAAAGGQELPITVVGAAVGDDVLLQVGGTGAPTGGIIYSARVSAADTVTVRAQNVTAGAVDPASVEHRVIVFKAY